MTITREQLELAARAAGIDTYPLNNTVGGGMYWQPHIDHGQLLDLAMACNISILTRRDEIEYALSGVLHYKYKKVDCQDFTAIAEAVISAAAEQQQAKETKE